jgi:hypothetical protein
VALLFLRGWPLRLVLAGQVAALAAVTVLTSVSEPLLWVHPFGPLTKNVPAAVATAVLLIQAGRCRAA